MNFLLSGHQEFRRAEDSKLHTAERLANLAAVFCILSWRVLWILYWPGPLPRRRHPPH